MTISYQLSRSKFELSPLLHSPPRSKAVAAEMARSCQAQQLLPTNQPIFAKTSDTDVITSPPCNCSRYLMSLPCCPSSPNSPSAPAPHEAIPTRGKHCEMGTESLKNYVDRLNTIFIHFRKWFPADFGVFVRSGESRDAT